ncbi:MAG TPA: hypothetical protein VGV35_11155 [Bryobacteraceae bacterium]|nr:hypothetical protein [Bryobacteraceae bacterium]
MRTVNLEKKFRRAAEAQALGHFVPDEILRGVEAFESAIGIIVVADNGNQDAGGAGIVGHLNLGDAGQADARIAQFALEDGFDLLPQRLAQAIPVIFLAATFHRS